MRQRAGEIADIGLAFAHIDEIQIRGKEMLQATAELRERSTKVREGSKSREKVEAGSPELYGLSASEAARMKAPTPFKSSTIRGSPM